MEILYLGNPITVLVAFCPYETRKASLPDLFLGEASHPIYPMEIGGRPLRAVIRSFFYLAYLPASFSIGFAERHALKQFFIVIPPFHFWSFSMLFDDRGLVASKSSGVQPDTGFTSISRPNSPWSPALSTHADRFRAPAAWHIVVGPLTIPVTSWC